MPAIVDKETFERVQRVLDSRSPRPRDRGHRYALTGRLFDGDGNPMVGTSGTGRNGTRHYYYRAKGGQRVRCDVVERCVADAVAAAVRLRRRANRRGWAVGACSRLVEQAGR